MSFKMAYLSICLGREVEILVEVHRLRRIVQRRVKTQAWRECRGLLAGGSRPGASRLRATGVGARTRATT